MGWLECGREREGGGDGRNVFLLLPRLRRRCRLSLSCLLMFVCMYVCRGWRVDLINLVMNGESLDSEQWHVTVKYLSS